MLEIIEIKLFSREVHKLLFSVGKREFTCNSHAPIQYSPLLFVCFEAVARGLYDISNNRLKCVDISGITLLFNYNF